MYFGVVQSLCTSLKPTARLTSRMRGRGSLSHKALCIPIGCSGIRMPSRSAWALCNYADSTETCEPSINSRLHGGRASRINKRVAGNVDQNACRARAGRAGPATGLCCRRRAGRQSGVAHQTDGSILSQDLSAASVLPRYSWHEGSSAARAISSQHWPAVTRANKLPISPLADGVRPSEPHLLAAGLKTFRSTPSHRCTCQVHH